MSTVKQLSVTAPNPLEKPADICSLLEENGIGILGLHLEGGGHSAILRLVCNDPDKAANILQSFDIPVSQEEVIAVESPRHPGGLAAVLKSLQQAGVRVEALYSMLGGDRPSILVLLVDNPSEGAEALRKNWLHVYGTELYRL